MLKPYISVVVPCYKSSKYLPRLLDSVLKSNKSNGDIEVILVDDCSGEDYIDIVTPYIKSGLNVTLSTTDYHAGNPANGRNKGASLAQGEYITFVDHDDQLDPEGIQKFRQFIPRYNNPEFVVCGIRQVNDEGKIEAEQFNLLTYTHAKFYHTTKFWKRYHLEFRKDMYYLEDMYMSALCSCVLAENGLEPYFTDFVTYVWNNNPESLGHKIKAECDSGDPVANMRRFLCSDNITRDVLFKSFDKGKIPKEIITEWLLRNIVQMYLDIEYTDICKQEMSMIYIQTLKDTCKRLQFHKKDLINYFIKDPNGNRIFNDEVNSFFMTHLMFNPKETFYVFNENLGLLK